MSDVARKAGVSTMTVSRALKDGASIAEETRERIKRAVDELGYVLDQSAGSLSSKRTGFVAALIPSINNSNFADTARGLTDALKGTGLQILLSYTDYSVEKEEELIESMLRRRPEAIVVTGGKHTERGRRLLENAGIPVIETWDLPAKPIQHVVGFSNAEASAALVRYLHKQGYRKIGFIGGTTNRDTRGADRRMGYERAMAELGLKETRVISFGTPPISMKQGGEALAKLIEQWPEVEAAICVSDLSAFGALMECQKRKWAVPKRVAIAGFGDFEISSCSYPTITTVGVHCYDIGRRAGELLMRAIEGERTGKPTAPDTVITRYEVIAREST
ncbi:LacI family DNA-binding transcriptional regulator [Aestuariivirga litoralis]|uniref:LacI family DNA-binding transcriptional regulator n=1 Tax=Aestuariivirga litoralis TaxID=2650924 RepID=UPI0018C7ADAC|nr:LacI family DNA-binding transcriptional regulator [Aestuariivirga litoralis]MBG1233287.1 LacI family DNA-binding transcriptional regulator [Aestuariivirga litoralis]